MKSWAPVLQGREGPKYLAIADAIAADVAAGRLAPGDRLPPQRDLAGRLALDFTTVARGYVEAGKRGLVESVIGRGTFIRRHASVRGDAGPQRSRADFTMNMPPEPDDPELLARMREGFASVGADLDLLLRYQGFGGSPMDRDAAASWLGRRALVPSQERIFLAPGAHGAMVGIFSLLARAGDTVLCEAITYPGVRSICAQLGLQLIGVEMDGDGVIPEALEEAMRRHAPKAIYLNPTLQNPKTITIPERRRAAICSLARRLQVPIVEDDAYGFIPTHGPPPLAAIAPDICWHIAGLAKCIGAGLRLAYVVAPDAPAAWSFNSAMRGLCVMASPISAAIATRWINDGTAELDPAIHSFGKHRQRAHRREGLGAGHVSLRSAELQHLAADAQWLDPLGLREPGAGERSWRRSERRLRGQRRAARSRARRTRRANYAHSGRTGARVPIASSRKAA